jgi:hypothetical protein
MAEYLQPPLDEATLDLLIKQVTDGLSAAEQRELDVLDSAIASDWLRDLEQAAAAIALAGSVDSQAMPAELERRVADQAQQHFAAGQTGAPTAAVADRKIADLEATRAASSAERLPLRFASRRGAYGWLAAAACLVVAVFGWLRAPTGAPTVTPTIAPPVVQTPPPVVPPPAQEPVPRTPAEQRAALLARLDTIKISLGATKEPAAAGMKGDVVWDPVTQRGYLHFTGLAANDPSVHQYQIWIFDGSRDKRYPVDGGVFDVPANTNEVVIPIRAALMVRNPAAFAVTVEKPGGVVVSGREHVVALGAAG